MNDGNKAKPAAAPAVAILAVDTRFHDHMGTLLPFKPDRAALRVDEAVRAATAQLNAALQAGYFILAVRARGLAAGPMSGFDAAALDADFFPDGHWRALLVVNIGYPGENPWFERLPRLDLAACLRLGIAVFVQRAHTELVGISRPRSPHPTRPVSPATPRCDNSSPTSLSSKGCSNAQILRWMVLHCPDTSCRRVHISSAGSQRCRMRKFHLLRGEHDFARYAIR